MAIHPYMPTCQQVGESVSAFTAAFNVMGGDKFFMGLMAKY